MKKLFLSALLFLSFNILSAQTKPVTAKTTAPGPVSILKTLKDSASYAVGVSVANAYKNQGIARLNTLLVSKAINDIMADKKPLFDDGTANMIINSCLLKIQSEKLKPKPVTVKPVTPTKSVSILKSLNDSVSYAVGINVAYFYKQLEVTSLNTSIVSKAINEIMAGKKVLFNDATVNMVMNKYLSEIQEEKSKPTILEGEKFLSQNKLRPEVKTTASGLQYEAVTEGTGQSPMATDSVTCNYKGTYINGTEFDNSYKRGAPITFALNGVIRGWTEGLQLMKVGSKYKFYVPYTLGYGAYDYNGIPGGSALLFEVDLLDVKKVIVNSKPAGQ